MKNKTTAYLTIILVFLILLLTLIGNSWGWHPRLDLLTIEKPEQRQQFYAEPVEIYVRLEDGARPDTFRAWLNFKEITEKFTQHEKGIRALVRPEDGLKVYAEKLRTTRDDKGIVNKYDWFQNLANPDAPQAPDTIIVQALDTVLEGLGDRPWGSGARGEIVYYHDILGRQVHATPLSQRSTYAHCVEIGHKGPVRIESMFPLGESGTILWDSVGEPVFDEHYFSMTPEFDGFAPREFPLFGKGRKN